MKNESKKTRTECDLLGCVEVPDNVLYGVQTMRGLENSESIEQHTNEIKNQIGKDLSDHLRKSMKKAFSGNKNIRIK